MTNRELEAIYAQAENNLKNNIKIQQKIKNCSDKELIAWITDVLTYGEPEVMPIASAIHTEAVSRGGETAEKAQWAWDNI